MVMRVEARCLIPRITLRTVVSPICCPSVYQLSNTISFNPTDREEVQEKAAPLPPLTSFIPIIETLPGLFLKDNYLRQFNLFLFTVVIRLTVLSSMLAHLLYAAM